LKADCEDLKAISEALKKAAEGHCSGPPTVDSVMTLARGIKAQMECERLKKELAALSPPTKSEEKR
jgi:hypothetical protein